MIVKRKGPQGIVRLRSPQCRRSREGWKFEAVPPEQLADIRLPVRESNGKRSPALLAERMDSYGLHIAVTAKNPR